MSESTDRLIARLAADGKRVQRLRPPLWRALGWLVVVTVIATPSIFALADFAVFDRRIQDPMLVVEMIGTLLTGIAGVIAAFQLSVPDRSPAWIFLPLPPLLLWVASTGISCWRHWIEFGPDGWVLGPTANCFKFIVIVSIPLGATLLFFLRRAMPLAPVRVAAVGGLGVAAIAAFLLQFFHPFDVTFMDLGIHVLAVSIVVGAASAIEARRSQRSILTRHV